MKLESEAPVIGLLAEFTEPDALLRAARALRDSDEPPRLEAFSPYPLEELREALGRPKSRLPLAMFCGGLAGALTGYGMQYFAMVIDYPINVGGRPLHSWPAFVPVTFELTVLFAALTGFFGWLFACRLPKPHHPVFNAASFRAASADGFFLLAYTPDREPQRQELRRQLQAAGATAVTRLYA